MNFSFYPVLSLGVLYSIYKSKIFPLTLPQLCCTANSPATDLSSRRPSGIEKTSDRSSTRQASTGGGHRGHEGSQTGAGSIGRCALAGGRRALRSKPEPYCSRRWILRKNARLWHKCSSDPYH